jgi:hypothetical protein
LTNLSHSDKRDFNLAAGVLIVAPLGHVDVAANLIRRQLTPNDDNSPWEAICILGFGSEPAKGFEAKSFTNLNAIGHVNAISSLQRVAPSRCEPVWSIIHATVMDEAHSAKC